MRSKFYIILTVLVAAVLLTGCAGAAFAQGPTETPPPGTPPTRTVSVNGSGKVYLTPDIAYITIGVHTEGPKATDAVKQNSDQTQAVISTLKSQGIADKDIQTSNFSIYPQQQFDDQGKPTGEIKYAVDNSVLVTIRDITKVGDVLDATVSSGANSINGVQFDVENKTAALSDARKAAVADAKAKAQELADAAGLTLGDVQSISEYSSGGPVPMQYEKLAAAPQAAGSVPIQPGQLLVTLDVNVVYFIK